MSDFEIMAIDVTRMDRIRASGIDEYGNPVEPKPAAGWEPVAVICFSPWTSPSPWLEAGPVFVHVEVCPGYGTPFDYPPDFADSPSMFNTFYADGSRDYAHIRFVEPGEAHTAALSEVLEHPEVDHLHARSSTAGCFTFAVKRAG